MSRGSYQISRLRIPSLVHSQRNDLLCSLIYVCVAQSVIPIVQYLMKLMNFTVDANALVSNSSHHNCHYTCIFPNVLSIPVESSVPLLLDATGVSTLVGTSNLWSVSKYPGAMRLFSRTSRSLICSSHSSTLSKYDSCSSFKADTLRTESSTELSTLEKSVAG